MTFDCTVVVATFGDDPKWPELAQSRAIPSAEALGVPVIWHHGTCLSDARNGGLAQVTTEHIVTLDADDELEAGYMDAMAAATADVRAPAHRFFWQGRAQKVKVPKVAGHHRHQGYCTGECLPEGNWVGVGACWRTDLLQSIGWEEVAYAEDWLVVSRAWLGGAKIEAVPKAVYRVHISPKSRMRGLTRPQIVEGHNEVAELLGFPLVG